MTSPSLASRRQQPPLRSKESFVFVLKAIAIAFNNTLFKWVGQIGGHVTYKLQKNHGIKHEKEHIVFINHVTI